MAHFISNIDCAAALATKLACKYSAHALRGWMWLLVFGGIVLGSSRTVAAGCDFGHGKHSRMSSESDDQHGYARHFRVLGQWVYEGGDIKYVAWEPDSPCQGPDCSANKERQPVSSGLPLSQNQRTHTSAVAYSASTQVIPPSLIDVLPLKDAKALHGYPPAYEYPP